jgi:hypothetical protein
MEDFKIWVIKVILPALAGISIKLAIIANSSKLSWFNASVSIIVAICTAYLLGDIVVEHVSPHYAPVIIGTLAILSEKICYWLIYKFDIESIFDSFVDKIKNKK